MACNYSLSWQTFYFVLKKTLLIDVIAIRRIVNLMRQYINGYEFALGHRHLWLNQAL